MTRGRRVVLLAPTLAEARRGPRRGGALAASPRAEANLVRALEENIAVAVVAPASARAFWALAARRYLLPAAPALLRHAISGISRRSGHGASGRPSGTAPGPAFYIEGKLDDARAARLLAAPDRPRLWVVEDFRCARLTDRAWRALRRAGVRVCALRALRARRVGRR